MAGWLRPCPGADELRGTGAAGAGYVDGLACLVVDDDAAGCVRSSATVRCAGDWDCPAGAVCSDVPRVDGAAGTLAVCEPGWHGLSLDDLPGC